MATNDNDRQNQQEEQRQGRGQRQNEQEENKAQETNKTEDEHPGYVEGKREEDDGDTVRALATDPESNAAIEGLDGMPEGDDYVGMLEHKINPPASEEVERQQFENLPRASADLFDPAETFVEEARHGTAASHRSINGRVVVVEQDCIYDGEVYKAGMQDISTDAANALMEEGLAWEPAGKKRGR